MQQTGFWFKANVFEKEKGNRQSIPFAGEEQEMSGNVAGKSIPRDPLTVIEDS